MGAMAARKKRKKRPGKNTWAYRLQSLRVRKDLSQDQAAAYLEIPVSTLRGWEQDRHEPPPHVQRFVLERLEAHSG